MISRRASRWSRHDPFLVKAHFACLKDRFHPETNPGGYVNFGTAENHLLFDDISPLLDTGMNIIEADTHYNELHGAEFFREAIAGFLGNRAGRALSPGSIAVASGASGILESLSFVICDPGDAILIPAPYYSGFDHDLALRSEARLEHIPLASPDFLLTLDAVEEAYSRAVSEGAGVKAVLLNSPQNPLGHVYSEELVRRTVDFAEERGIHVILDEIYAESLMPGVRHFSGLELESQNVHVVYGFAKDFGLSGYKVGLLHSENTAVIKAVQDSAYFHTVSMQTQRTLANVLRSPELKSLLETLRVKLLAGYEHAASELSSAGITFLPVKGGIVAWLDLRQFLKSRSFDSEHELFASIFDTCKVNISPGRAFHCVEPGWFRMCFTMPEADRVEGLRRLTDYLETT